MCIQYMRVLTAYSGGGLLVVDCASMMVSDGGNWAADGSVEAAYQPVS